MKVFSNRALAVKTLSKRLRRFSTALAALAGFSSITLLSTAKAYASGAKPEVSCPAFVQGVKPLKTGFKWTEGPAWDPTNSRWIFSDLMGDTEYTVTVEGKLVPVRNPAGYPNGHALLKDGSFVVAQHDRKLGTINANGTDFKLIATSFGGKKLNSPNDMVVAKNGDIFFTDPPYGIQGYGPVKAAQDLPYQGVFLVRDGKLQLVNNDLKVPNGIAISPDQKILYVSNTSDDTIYKIDISTFKGSPIPAQKFIVFEQVPGGHIVTKASDGLRVDSKGNIWATGPGGIRVFSDLGTPICSIPFDKHVANLAAGGPTNKSILVTSADTIYLIQLKNSF